MVSGYQPTIKNEPAYLIELSLSQHHMHKWRPNMDDQNDDGSELPPLPQDWLVRKFQNDEEKMEVLDVLPSTQALQRLMQIAKLRAQEQTKPDNFGQYPSYKETRGRSRVLYLLLQEDGALRLSMAAESAQSKRSLTSLRPVGREMLLAPSPPSYATRGDVDIARLWRRITGDTWNYEDLSGAVPEAADALIKRIIETNRCYLFEHIEGPHLQYAQELEGRLHWLQNAEDRYGLCLMVMNEKGQAFQSLSLMPPWYVDRETGLCGPIKTNLSEEVLRSVAGLQDLERSELQALPFVVDELKIKDVIPSLNDGSTVTVEVVAPTPTLGLELAHPAIHTENAPSTEAPFKVRKNTLVPMAKIVLPEITSKTSRTADGGLKITKPDSFAAGRFENKLVDLGLFKVGGFSIGKGDTGSYFGFADKDEWLTFLSKRLPELRADGWQISPEVERILTPINLASDAIKIEAEPEPDNCWLMNIAMNIVVDGTEVPLRPVLEAALNRLPDRDLDYSVDALDIDGFFPFFLPDGRIVQLPFDRVRNVIVTLGEAIRRGVSKRQVTVCASDLANLKDIWCDSELLQKLKRLGQPLVFALPKNFRAELREYQTGGVEWLQRLAREEMGGILADDMGLGKTVQLLAHICIEKASGRLTAPFLVVCPKNVIYNWMRECKKFAPELRVLPFMGAQRWSSCTDFKEQDLVLMSYHSLAKDRHKMKAYKWHGVALDESQYIKNATTTFAEAVRQLQANHRFAVTGTPMENNLGELWSQFQFTLPGFLGSREDFSDLRRAIENGDRAAKAFLARRVRPFLLRRTKGEVLKDLPPKSTTLHYVHLHQEQQDLYETARVAWSKKVQHSIETYGFEHSQILIIEALLRLRQICCDPRLVKWSSAQDTKVSAKLKTLIELVAELLQQDRRILIFSQFRTMLDIIASSFSESNIPFGKLDGQTKHRRALIHKFQNGEFPVFLISLKVGGVGLNLTTADVVILYDPWWNPAVEDQAADRAHRIGQSRPVSVYKLIAHGTIEQRMIELQERKRALCAGLFDENAAHSFKLSKTDIDLLLAPIAPY